MENGNCKKIYIRADGNEVIATGHIMRCLSIAEQLRRLDIEVIFVTADSEPCSIVESRGFHADILHTVWNDLDSETEVICEYAQSHEAEVFLIDSYFVTAKYLERLSNYSRIVYMDDLLSFPYAVDALINYSVFADVGRYRELYMETGRKPKFLLGGDYIPLREEFEKVTFDVERKINKVLITTGGTDILNMSGRLLEEFMKDDILSEWEYHVIAGRFNVNKDMLYRLAEEYSGHIFIHENVNNMSEWMRTCDVAVSASGSTLYELCVCGVPAVCFEIADNQKGADAWQKKGYMLYAGNAAEDAEGCIGKCVEALLWYSLNYAARVEMSKRMQRVVDGKGAMRIAQYIEGMTLKISV